ncbi:ribosomal-processing cysteine protease Prp [Clostridiales bacterium COT073_COT-073]|nr:ribosomal-processing cysteine protease Prp [Clostridiales bacterium COT073_COT-073]
MRNLLKKSSGIYALIEKSGDEYIGFVISGHAGYAPKGRDIVCAAVSMISIQTVNAVEALTTSKSAVEDQDGYLRFHLQNSTPEAQLLLKSYDLGLQMILQEYGNEYIHIEYKEV